VVDGVEGSAESTVEGAVERWDQDGFVVLPSFFSPEELAPAIAQLAGVFPTADEFHDDIDPERNARFRSEFDGIVDFPVGSVEIDLLCVHPRLVGLAAALLRTDDLRMVSAEAWAKYTGAANYDQPATATT
jgi:hypothetical protein